MGLTGIESPMATHTPVSYHIVFLSGPSRAVTVFVDSFP